MSAALPTPSPIAKAHSLTTWATMRPSTRPGASSTHAVRRPKDVKNSSARRSATSAVAGGRVSSTMPIGGSAWKPTAEPPWSKAASAPSATRIARGAPCRTGESSSPGPHSTMRCGTASSGISSSTAQPAWAASTRSSSAIGRKPLMTTRRSPPPPGSPSSGSCGRCGSPSLYVYQPRPVLRPSRPAATICALSGDGRQRGSPKLSSWNDWATSNPTSIPTRSCSSNGPIRKPAARTIASIVGTSARRSCSSRSASSPNGRFVRLTRKPGPSVASMTRRPIASPAARATASASSEDSRPAMTSTRGIRGAGLKKCRPTTRDGSAAARAIAVIGIDEVLEASTASGATCGSTANSSCLSSRRSGAASTMSCAGARSSSAPATSRAPGVPSKRPLARSFSVPARARRTPSAAAPSTGSKTSVRAPDWAASWAMPEPIVPAPTTPTTSGGDEGIDPGLRAADDELLDLRGALVERRHAHVAEVALDGVVVGVARAAVQLDRLVGAVLRGLGRVELGDRGLRGRRPALVLEEPGAPHEHPRRVRLDPHLRDHRLHELEGADRPPELLALLGVGDGGVERALADAHAPRRDGVAAGVERAHRDLEAVAHLAHQRVVAHADAIERERRRVRAVQAHLAVDLLAREALGLRRHEEGGEPAVLLLRVRLGEDQRHLGVVAERDPHLVARDLPAAVDLLRARALVGRVGARVGLRQPEAAERLARAQRREPALLLLLRAPAHDRGAHERGLHGHDRAHRRAAAPDLLDQERIGDVVEARAAVLARDDRAEVALGGDLAHELGVEVVVAVVLSRAWDDLPVREVASRLADQLLLV